MLNKFNFFNEQLNTSMFGKPWSKEKLEEIRILKSKIEGEEDTFKILLKRYLLLNQDIQEQQIIELDEDVYVQDYQYNNNTIEFTYYTESSYDEFPGYIGAKEFQDFLIFLDNPELYENSKKYNL